MVDIRSQTKKAFPAVVIIKKDSIMSQIIDKIKREVLSRINLLSEFESWGCFKFTGKQSVKGFMPCFSPFREEKNPSCGLNVDNSSSYAGMLKIFNSSGPRQVIQFFDLARELNPTYSGREFIDILKAYADKVGIEFEDYKPKPKVKKDIGEIVAIYDYLDVNDNLVYQVCKYQKPNSKNKTFRQRHPAPNSTKLKPVWIWNMQGIIPVPYLLKNILNNKTIFGVEGEKDADSLTKLGLPAFTLLGGAGKWYPEVLPYFKDKNIILLPDNDALGREHMERLAHVFIETAASIKIVELPGLEQKGDISNWIASGGTKEKLLDLCKKTLVYEATEDPIDELNLKHAVIKVGGKVRILDETNDISGCPNVQFLTEYDFKTLYANRKVSNPLAGQKGQPKHIQLATAWLSSSKRRGYQGIIFEPQIKNDKFYNLFNGFAYQPICGDWSLFKNHIFENICSKNLRDFDWLMSWLARIVQKPGGKKPGTAVVLRGERGTGKGVFVEIFGKIFGHHFLQVTNSKQVTGQFNAHLKNCLLLFLDEAWFAGDKSSESVLKGLITSDRHMVELKGKDAFMVSNHVNCIVASNSSWVVPVGNKERRFFLLDISNNHIQDHKYFQAISNQMYLQNGISAMLYDLLLIDISKHNLREAPKTKGLFDQLLQNLSSFEQFWFEKLISNNDLGNFDSETNENNMIQKSKLHDEYINYCNRMGLKYILSLSIFGKNLTKYCDFDVKQKLGSEQKYVRFYVFPEKTACRNQFSKQVGMKIDWESSQVEKIKNEVDKI
jgi:hypothetical protein